MSAPETPSPHRLPFLESFASQHGAKLYQSSEHLPNWEPVQVPSARHRFRLFIITDMSPLIEEVERAVRAHPLAAVVAATVALYTVCSWLFLGPNLVCNPLPNHRPNLYKSHIQRLYIADSTWYYRWTDVFRAFTRCRELSQKAYETVLTLPDNPANVGTLTCCDSSVPRPSSEFDFPDRNWC